MEGLVKERGRAELWEHGGAAIECQSLQQEPGLQDELSVYRGALGFVLHLLLYGLLLPPLQTPPQQRS